MREQFEIRTTKRAIAGEIRSYPAFQGKWLRYDDGLIVIIEGYLNDPEFQAFLSYLRGRIPYENAFINRKYAAAELVGAQLLTMWIRATFEPTGEEMGTRYNYPCTTCEAGRTVDGSLILNLTKVPKGKDIAKTIAMDEWVVSERLADLMRSEKITGADLKPVQHYGKRAISEQWYQLVVTSTVSVAEETVLGPAWKPGVRREDVSTACGHALNTIVYSELFIENDSWNGSDVAITDLYFGGRLNLLNFYPHILISRRFYRLLREHKMKGYEVEVAHLVKR